MSSTEQIIFYATNFSPYAHRVGIALEEAGANYTTYLIDTRNKPSWYYRVSPLGKVPAIAYGGPHSPPDQPSPQSEKLFESLALLEFVADVFPQSKLLPANPVLRAKARAFIALYQNYVNDLFRDTFFVGKPLVDALFSSLETLQGALPPTGFAAGDFSIAEAAVLPFLARMFLFLEAGLGKYTAEDGEKMKSTFASERFARLRRYLEDARERPSFKKTWGSDAAQIEIGKTLPILRRPAP
ncbi:thioredoxin-like protein [Trametes meyenii]|nr:thioredoxin-like protein [Trametes meyenii]